MENIIGNLIYSFSRPSTVMVLGDGRECGAEAVFSVLSKHFSVSKAGDNLPLGIASGKILIFENRIEEQAERARLSFLIKKSRKPVIALTHFGKLGVAGQVIDSEKSWDGLKAAIEEIPESASLIYNADSPMIRKAAGLCAAGVKISVGFSKDADFQASDVRIGRGLNFKARVKGSLLPVWLSYATGKEQIYSALIAIAAGKIFELNLIQTAEAVKAYRSVPGRMGLIECQNGSTVIDNTKSASLESELEALEILGNMQCFGQKIAVLSGQADDQAGSSSSIEMAALKNADFLFETGTGAEAGKSGANLEKIFKSDMIDVVIKKLKTTVKNRDLILVGGSKNFDFQAIVRKLRTD